MTKRANARFSRQSGYFGICVYHPKSEANVGTLLRSAKTFNAALVATVGPRRYEHQASDTCKTPLSVPLQHFSDIDDLIEHLPHGCPLIGIEMSPSSVLLHEFAHPTRAMYLLGAEDHGLPEEVLKKCHYVVQIASPAHWSMNVSVAGSVVLYDRYMKRLSKSLEVAA